MSFFRFPVANNDVAPLFRILEEFDPARRGPRTGCPRAARSFQPRFDVTESKQGYELHGELPGIDRENIEITFSDSRTLKIAGKAARAVTTAPADVADADAEKPEVEMADAEKQDLLSEDYETISSAHQQPSVEDEEPAAAPASTAGSEKTVEPEQEQSATEKPQPQDGPKYWVTERAVGSFQRSFSFASRVDTDRVKATMKNGVLSIVVPKMAEQQSRRIMIE